MNAPDPERSALIDGDIGHLMAGVAWALGSRELVALAELGLDLRSYGVLAVAGEAERTQNAISTLLAIDRTTIAAIVDDLEAAGLVVRRPAPGDRRARLVVPTAAGRERIERAVARVRATEDECLADLGPDRRRELMAALTVLSRGRLAAPVDTAGAVATPRRRPRRGQPG